MARDAKKGIGRPSKLTPKVTERVCEALREGQTREVAAHRAGICTSSFYGWLAKAQEPDAEQRYLDFLAAVTQAELEAEDALIASWRSAARDDWRAAQKFVERRFPQRWGGVQKHEHSGPDGGAVKVEAEVKHEADPDRIAGVVGLLRDLGVDLARPGEPDDDGE